jgi:hypothetical protein
MKKLIQTYQNITYPILTKPTQNYMNQSYVTVLIFAYTHLVVFRTCSLLPCEFSIPWLSSSLHASQSMLFRSRVLGFSDAVLLAEPYLSVPCLHVHSPALGSVHFNGAGAAPD